MNDLEDWQVFSQKLKINYRRRGILGWFDSIKAFFTGKMYTSVEEVEIKFMYIGGAEPVDVMISGLYVHSYEKIK